MQHSVKMPFIVRLLYTVHSFSFTIIGSTKQTEKALGGDANTARWP